MTREILLVIDGRDYMKKLKCKEIIKVINGKLISGNSNIEFNNISIDSRKIQEGDLFIPIIGKNFDGHNFIKESLNNGAIAVITEKEYDLESSNNKVIIKVDNTRKALMDIATFYKSKFNTFTIGITGSVGKTCTKDMISCVLREKYNILKTEGNFYNEIGVPLTVFNLEDIHVAAVIEMGMSDFHEISNLTNIVKPNIAVITNIGLSHIQNLGSRHNILKAKLEILEGLENDGVVVLNGDDHLLYGLKDLLKFNTIFYGMEEGNDFQAYNVETVGEKGTYFEILIENYMNFK